VISYLIFLAGVAVGLACSKAAFNTLIERLLRPPVSASGDYWRDLRERIHETCRGYQAEGEDVCAYTLPKGGTGVSPESPNPNSEQTEKQP